MKKKKNIDISKQEGLTPQPDKPKSEFPIVGVGASAGGLEAFQQFLKHLPLDTGMAFVLVQHLDPTHESALSPILSKSTEMKVGEVKNETRVEPNQVYVIPPNTDLALSDGSLMVLPRPQGRHMPIDSFFKTLAQVRRSNAIGVVLSGSGSDGTLGLQAIKAEEGLTFAQDPKSAKYDQMPLSAVTAGCVDFILEPSVIAKELVRISQHPYLKNSKQLQAVNEDGEEVEESPEVAASDFNKILGLLRTSHKVDFTHYKHTTINRRILRRMLLHKIERLGNYVSFLKKTPSEVNDLFNDILINVTSFFRDPEAFQALKDVVFPSLLKDRASDQPIRIWVPGCATGQEVYSIVISLMEVRGDMASNAPFQVFATDISERAIEIARTGLYTANTLKEDVSSERLHRFFVKVESGYQISKQIRDSCVFAVQNVTADPPFSRMDLISCRNLLIYLGAPLQKRVLPIFHYALKDSGFLFLGNSETITGYSNLFSIEEKKHKIYSKIATALRPQFAFPTNFALHDKSEKVREPFYQSLDIGIELKKEAERIILNDHAPCGVIANDNMDIIQFRGDTSPYLAITPGKATLNLLKMAREGLSVTLRSLIQEVKKNGKAAKKDGLQLKINGHAQSVCVTVSLLKQASHGKENYFLILFREVASPIELKEKLRLRKGQTLSSQQRDTKLRELEQQFAQSEESLRATRESLQATAEAQEAANEELKSASEEILSSNEELQSTNEELETSKEELQSSNEELNTVNDELRVRNIESTQLNNDLINLLTSVKIPIVMVGTDLRVRRFNPAAEKLFRFISSDVGRPISDIKPSIVVPNLEALILDVIGTVAPRELEVQDQEKHWYSLLARPYRTVDNKIEGAVLIVLDINTIKEAANYAKSIVGTVPLPLLVLDGSLRVITANQSFYNAFKVPPLETEKVLVYELGNRQWDIPTLRKLLEEILHKKNSFDNYEVTHDFPGLGRKVMLLNARRILQEAGMEQQETILLAIEDITDRKRAESERALLAAVVSSAEDAILSTDLNGKIITWNLGAETILGYSRDEIIGKHISTILLLPEGLNEEAKIVEKIKHAEVFHHYETKRRRKDGQIIDVSLAASPVKNENGVVVGISKVLRNIKEQKELEERLAHTMADLQRSNEELERFAAVASHDLTEPLRTVSNYCQLLSNKYNGKLDEDGQQYLAFAVSGARRMSTLIRDLLEYSHVGSQAKPFQETACEEVVKQVTTVLEVLIKENEAEITVGPLPTVRGDFDQLLLLFQNLFSNAIKYRNKKLPPRIHVSSEQKENEWVFSVQDNGIGIEEENFSKIFDIFRRLHSQQDYAGTGIGLATCRKVVENHRGKIWVASEPRKGSTFFFTLPIAGRATHQPHIE